MDVPLPKPCSVDFQKANKRLFERMCMMRGLDAAKQTISPILQRLIENHRYSEKQINLWDNGGTLDEVIRRKGWVR